MRLRSAQLALCVFMMALFAMPSQTFAQEEAGLSDHQTVVNRFAVGYLGWRDIAHGTLDNRVSAPVVGIRYWFTELIGLDAGVGFGFEGGSVTVESGGTTTTTDVSGPAVFVIHGGVPLSLASSSHFSFQVVPELNLGFAHQTVSGGSSDGSSDLDLSGVHFDIGGRIGAEVHFGFMGVPQLSLQGSIGLFFLVESAKADDNGTNVVVSESHRIFSTTVYDNPWNIFIANVAALYYF